MFTHSISRQRRHKYDGLNIMFSRLSNG